jgi:antitoxin component YwqK of YwqJK toxin-antitoxin module
MKYILIFLIVIQGTQIGFCQNEDVAIKTSKNIYQLIQKKNYAEFIGNFEEDVEQRILEYQKTNNKNYIKETVDKYHRDLLGSIVDFNKYKTKTITPHSRVKDKLSESIAFQFEFGEFNDGLDYFEVAFKIGSDYSKVYSVNVVVADRMSNLSERKIISKLKIIHGAEEESIPTEGEIDVQRYSETGFLKKIKYRDFENLIISEYDEKQNKIQDTTYPLNDLGFKSLIEYYTNGNIKLIANYKNGEVIGNFTKFYKNGKIEKTGSYIMGSKKDGIWNYFDEKGKLINTELYEPGQSN